MVPGLLITSVVTVVMSAALFTRRAKSGWLDELADIRGGALSEPAGEIDRAVAEEAEEAEDGDRGPGATAAAEEWQHEAPDTSAAPKAEPATTAPHPLRPHEVWHAHDGLAEAPRQRPRTEERIAGEELQGDGATGDTAPRFRFDRLRPVGDDGGDEAPASGPVGAAEAGERGTPVAPGELFLHDHDAAGPTSAPDPAAVPLVPLTVERSTNGLIDGPVRRGRRGRRNGLESAGDPLRVLGLDGPEQDGLAPDGLTPGHDAPAPERSHQVDAPRNRPDGLADGADPAVDPTPAPVETSAPAAAAPAAPVALVPADDGTLPVAGIVRLDPGGRAEATRAGDGALSVAITGGWCWAATVDPVSITTPGGELTVPPATTALGVVEADGSTFLVVIGGEAVLTHPGGRLRLRAGAMVLIPAAGEPQVDVATEAEIASDPLVARNRALDAAG